jgi:flagellar basal-body rod modification protein FlgD
MSVSSALTGTASNVTAALNTANTANAVSDRTTLASNFTAFLTLLTTQLRHQNPLEPMDTNQFTQQLVQFAQVEQQLKSNETLTSLVSLQKSAQTTTALGFVGYTVAVDGSTAKMADGQALWRMQVPKPVNATVNIMSSTGQNVYSGTFAMNAGTQDFVWDGKGANGVQWPDGEYTISIVAQDAAGQSVAVPTEVEATVDSVDLTADPPLLSVAGKNYTIDKVKRIVRWY